MLDRLFKRENSSGGTIKRAVVKTVFYRVNILILDFVCIYLFTGKVEVAVGFTVVSNVYATLVYFIHERIWDRVDSRNARRAMAQKQMIISANPTV